MSDFIDIYKDMTSTFMRLEKDWTVDETPTGIKELDDIIGGFKNSELIVISSEPGTCKTTLALTILKNITVNLEKAVLYFNESYQPISERILQIMYGKSHEQLKEMNNERLWDSFDNMKKAPFYNETCTSTLEDIISYSFKAVRDASVRIICIDELQHLSLIDKTRPRRDEGQMHYIVYQLKELAKQLDIPIILLSNNLHEGVGSSYVEGINMQCYDDGACMEAADKFIKLSMPSQTYEVETNEKKELLKKACVEVRKNRNGRCGAFELAFDTVSGTFRYTNNKLPDVPKEDVPF